MSDDLVITRHEANVAVIEMNRPKALNALSQELLEALADALRAADADDSIRAVVLTGSDRAFSAGADLKALDGLTVGDVLDPNGFTSGFQIFNPCAPSSFCACNRFAAHSGNESPISCHFDQSTPPKI